MDVGSRTMPPGAVSGSYADDAEQAEREATEGELAMLEAAWQAAEEIAGIADNLLVPQSAEDFIRREKEKLADEPAPAHRS